MRDFPSFFFGFFVGALVAAGFALLFAPQRGEETRHMLATRTQEFSERARETAGQLGERAQEMMQRGQQMARQAREVPRTFGTGEGQRTPSINA